MEGYIFTQMKKVIIFGASGALGSACTQEFESHNWEVVRIGRDLSDLSHVTNISAAIWAQGENYTGAISETSEKIWSDLWEANVGYIVKCLAILTDSDALLAGSRLVILGSVWQNVARSNKTAYMATKSALSGIIRGLSVEFGPRNISINGVLPGIIGTPMTRANLTSEQISGIEHGTPGGKLVNPEQLASIVRFLASDESSGINGQSIIVDNGWAQSRDV